MIVLQCKGRIYRKLSDSNIWRKFERQFSLINPTVVTRLPIIQLMVSKPQGDLSLSGWLWITAMDDVPCNLDGIITSYSPRRTLQRIGFS